MDIGKIKGKVPDRFYAVLEQEKITELRPSQEKAVAAGLLEGKNLLVCTPTASGKTLIAEMAIMNSVLRGKGKGIYIVPLKALASEKAKDFKRKYGEMAKIALSIGNLDSSDPYLAKYDLIIVTAEKFDSLIRHRTPWLQDISVVVVDEIHLLNDASRGPTLEVLITILREVLPNLQLIGLSATIGNPDNLAGWLGAEPVIDTWRPVKLYKGIYHDGKVEFEK
ncbi:DEAD/DEAH box helicase [Candidatus Woesearchaeota archaeon]|nr:DEAD/DEAH box helicase [Candidatus Woesearchaeota archaeon]